MRKPGALTPIAGVAAAGLASLFAGLLDQRTLIPLARPIVQPAAPTIAIAARDDALTFARLADGRTIAVFSYRDGVVSGAPIGEDDAIAIINRLGYDGTKALIDSASARIDVAAAELAPPVALNDRHIAAGANYREHAREASVTEGPFLFPKYAAPTASRAPVRAGDGLLDYEVELCLVAMTPIRSDAPANGGLILCNDFTDRARLLREIDPDDPRSGKGFTDGKSAETFLPVGDLFVAPRDLAAFVSTLTLQLSVDGAERQRAGVGEWIWDLDRILEEARARRDVVWTHDGGEARLPFDETGAVAARTMILAGTPGGTVFRGIYPSAYAQGLGLWIAGGFRGALPEKVIAAHIRAARASRDYLQPGALVTIEVDRMGALANRVE